MPRHLIPCEYTASRQHRLPSLPCASTSPRANDTRVSMSHHRPPLFAAVTTFSLSTVLGLFRVRRRWAVHCRGHWPPLQVRSIQLISSDWASE